MTAVVGYHLDVERLTADFGSLDIQRGRTDMETALLIGLQGESIAVFDGMRHRAVDHRKTRTRRSERTAQHGKAIERWRLEIFALGIGLKNHLETLTYHDLFLGGDGQGWVVLGP